MVAIGLRYRIALRWTSGMESSKKSGAVDVSGPSAAKARQEEAKRINMSLLALSNVVNALASKGAMKVPFRDSKLTRLLQSSLAGNCKAAFVVMLRGEKQNVEEATLTLRFAQARVPPTLSATLTAAGCQIDCQIRVTSIADPPVWRSDGDLSTSVIADPPDFAACQSGGRDRDEE